MKISSASKKVLASALSAAMVVAFAPTAAFAAVSNYSDKGDATGITDDSAAAAGYVFKQVAEGTNSNTGKLVTTYYKANELNKASAGTVTLIADYAADEASKAFTVPAGVTLDLNGHKVTSSYEQENAPLVTVSNGATVKNGTVEATDYTDADGKTPITVDGVKVVGKTTLKDVTVDSVAGDKASVSVSNGEGGTTAKGVPAEVNAQGTVAVSGAVAAAVTADKKAVVTTGAITGAVSVGESASVTAVKEAKKGAATAVKGNVTVAKNGALSATATTTGNTDADESKPVNVDAVAIDGTVSFTGEGASVTASATTSGTAVGDNTADATAIKTDAKITVNNKQTLKATASVADDDATAIAVNTALEVKNGGTAEASASGSTDNGAKDVAVKGNLTVVSGATATFTGKVTGTSKSIEAGTFTADPAAWVDSAKYDVVDNGTSFTVKQAEGFTLNDTIAGGWGKAQGEQSAVVTAVQNALDVSDR